MQKSVLDFFKLDGQVALVIGGNRGLGLSMATALAEGGAAVSIAARDEEENKKAACLLQCGYKTQSMATYCDVTKEESIKDVVAKTVERFGKIDILINS